jgi:hypothetical protein
VRLVADGSLCCVGVVIGGCAWMFLKMRLKNVENFGTFDFFRICSVKPRVFFVRWI